MSPEDKIDRLLQDMSIEEKVSLLAGSDLWHTTPVARLGVPKLRVSDGPNGVRGTSFTGPPSACFPCGVSLAASWCEEVVGEVGHHLAKEAKAKNVRVILGPTVNLHRTPIGGRNFECFSEDPLLTSRTALAYVTAVQADGVACCIKHFVANDTEFERMTVSSEVDDRTLRELYLIPFESAIYRAGVKAVMAAYNRLNGVYASEHPWLLTHLLREEWGYQGLVMSDWFGLHSTAAGVLAGLDLEMPGPTARRGEKLIAEVEGGQVPVAAVEANSRRVLQLLDWCGVLSGEVDDSETTRRDPQTASVIRNAATEGTVLLKNEQDLLPLDPDQRVALIGPNADNAAYHGGGSAALRPERRVSPLAAMSERVANLRYEPGCVNHKSLPPLDDRTAKSPDGEPGLRISYLNPDGARLRSEVVERANLVWLGSPVPEARGDAFRVVIEARVSGPRSGDWTFGLVSTGPATLHVDGALIVDNREPKPAGTLLGFGSTEVTGSVEMGAGEVADVRVELSTVSGSPVSGLIVGALAPMPAHAMEDAVQAASQADVAVVVIGTGDQWESESHDRDSMDLPGDQDELVRRVAAANPRTVVVINAASPVCMDWTTEVPAVVQTWFPGQEFGHSLADVLFGDAEPGGRLPVTLPRRIQDTPAYLNHPGEAGRCSYAEGLYVGYRWYDARDIEPWFCFGHGLGYTTFSYGEIAVSGHLEGGHLEVRVPVTNVGRRAGKEVVQLYVHPPQGQLRRPEQHLGAFAVLRLEPGETGMASLHLDKEAFRIWDPGEGSWVVPSGDYELRVGASSRDIRGQATTQL